MIAAAAIWLAFKKLGLNAQQQIITAWEWISKLDRQRPQPENLHEMASQWWLHLLQTEWEPVESRQLSLESLKGRAADTQLNIVHFLGVIRAVIDLWSSSSELKKLPTFDVSKVRLRSLPLLMQTPLTQLHLQLQRTTKE